MFERRRIRRLQKRWQRKQESLSQQLDALDESVEPKRYWTVIAEWEHEVAPLREGYLELRSDYWLKEAASHMVDSPPHSFYADSDGEGYWERCPHGSNNWYLSEKGVSYIRLAVHNARLATWELPLRMVPIVISVIALAIAALK